MGWILLAVAVLALAIVLVVFGLKTQPAKVSAFPYLKNDALFSPAERSFLGVLDQMLGEQYRIMGKVRIADVVSVEPLNGRGKTDPGNRQAAFNRISAKHFDFILCDKNTMAPVAAIELDDKSHSVAHRRERDDFITGVCDAASLPLLRVPARRVYSCSDVQRLIVNALRPGEEAAEPLAAPRAQAATAEVGVAEVQVAASPASNAAASKSAAPAAGSPPCPKCSSSMILRRVKRGARAGERLWGCIHYPACRGIVPMKRRVQPGSA